MHMGRNLAITHFTLVLLKTQCDLYPYMSCQNSLNTVSHALQLLLIKNLFLNTIITYGNRFWSRRIWFGSWYDGFIQTLVTNSSNMKLMHLAKVIQVIWMLLWFVIVQSLQIVKVFLFYTLFGLESKSEAKFTSNI